MTDFSSGWSVWAKSTKQHFKVNLMLSLRPENSLTIVKTTPKDIARKHFIKIKVLRQTSQCLPCMQFSTINENLLSNKCAFFQSKFPSKAIHVHHKYVVLQGKQFSERHLHKHWKHWNSFLPIICLVLIWSEYAVIVNRSRLLLKQAKSVA